jgi:zinc protease
LASIEVARQLAPYDKDNIRYVPTLEERIDQARKVSVEDIRKLHQEQLSALHGEVTAVGDFDPDSLATAFDELFQGWKTDVAFERIPVPASTGVPGSLEEILTPGKANAVYYASEHIAMPDDHPDYPALVVGNYVMGASALSSRLGNRVRQQEGLSYSVGSGLNAHPIDERAVLTLYAICNPENKDKLLEVIREEIQLLLEKGITEDELASAKQGILQSSQVTRTEDRALASILGSTIFAGRDMGYYADFEDSISNLTKEQVDRALRSYIAPDRLVIRIAGDFEKAE